MREKRPVANPPLKGDGLKRSEKPGEFSAIGNSKQTTVLNLQSEQNIPLIFSLHASIIFPLQKGKFEYSSGYPVKNALRTGLNEKKLAKRELALIFIGGDSFGNRHRNGL